MWLLGAGKEFIFSMAHAQQRRTSISYLRRLSKAQWEWLIGSLAVCIAIVTVGWALEPRGEQAHPSFSTAMSIRDIAPKLGVTGKALARELGLPPDVPRGKPVKIGNWLLT
jgi:hypothetical protein